MNKQKEERSENLFKSSGAENHIKPKALTSLDLHLSLNPSSDLDFNLSSNLNPAPDLGSSLIQTSNLGGLGRDSDSDPDLNSDLDLHSNSDLIPNLQELNTRLINFVDKMDKACSGWQHAIIFGKVNQFYFTGTMQDAFLVIKPDGNLYYFVRKSFERARLESPIKNIFQIRSYRDARDKLGQNLGRVYIDQLNTTMDIWSKFSSAFTYTSFKSLDYALLQTRAVKSYFELSIMRRSGQIHNRVLSQLAPALLKEGINEADFTASLFKEMVASGYQGLSRFSMFETDMVAGQIAFGDNSIYPTSFDGPGGNLGVHPAVPTLGSARRFLQKGDHVFIDVAFGIAGYHTDKTVLYSYGLPAPDKAHRAHQQCVDIQNMAASMLKPGEIPSKIYETIIKEVPRDFLPGFMGRPGHEVRFLGHGIGLNVDEYPVIASSFHEPLEENMVIALEPKKTILGYGLVGTEDTYVVTKGGGQCITGQPSPIRTID